MSLKGWFGFLLGVLLICVVASAMGAEPALKFSDAPRALQDTAVNWCKRLEDATPPFWPVEEEIWLVWLGTDGKAIQLRILCSKILWKETSDHD